LASITFLGGVNEIGGNKFLFDDGSARVLFDFGKNFERERKYFDEPYLSPGEEKHLLALGILPDIPGLYQYDENTPLDIDAIFLTHVHQDHTQYVGYVKDDREDVGKEDVPIYCSELTRQLMIARDYASGGKIAYKVARMTASEETVYKTFHVMAPGTPVSIGNMNVTCYDVDHSVPGASAFLIEMNNKRIAYTGDLRVHGTTDHTTDFLSTVSQQSVDYLLTEGTNMGRANLYDETTVGNDVTTLLQNHNRCTFVSSAMYDLYRLNTLYKAAKAHQKTLVIPVKQAFIIDQISSTGQFLDLNLAAPDIKIFQKQKSRYDKYEQVVEQKYASQVNTCQDLRAIQNELVFMVSFFDMNEMCDFQPAPGSQFIVSQSEPHNEEMEIDYQKLMNWLERYRLPAYSTHCSGHIRPHELKQLIKTINPDHVIPIHTEKPTILASLVKDLGKQTILPTEKMVLQI
jgi:ribonuclease J